MQKPRILPIGSKKATLAVAGGKGANLSKLAQAGFPVPGGFLITTEAYREFVLVNNLQSKILDSIAVVQLDDPITLQNTSKTIRGWFSGGALPPDVVDPLRDWYLSLGGLPVAVRSSATAEDLPDMSFAGQHDTFLNIIGEDALIKAVVDCWSSLWTARAIGYRFRNGISHENVALAAVVQEMMLADASGILFTANPLTGARIETVIDATLGLGEALVSGQVEPDHYVIDTPHHQILNKTLGAKAVIIHPSDGGGIHSEGVEAADKQAIPDDVIKELTQLGRQVAEIYDFPQDIEWAWADGKLYLLQSRPITSLFPLPEGMEPDPLRVMFSFAAVQGILEPITPLGQDTIRMIFAGGASLFGLQVTHKTLGLIYSAAQRLWVDITPLLRNTIGRKIAPRLISAVEPSIVKTLQELIADSRLTNGSGRPRISSVRRLLKFALPFFQSVLSNWRYPDTRAEQILRESDREVDRLRAESASYQGDGAQLAQRLALYKEIYHAFPFAVPKIVPGIAAGLIPLFMLNKITRHTPNDKVEVLEITRGLPNNVTTEMDLALWEAASIIRADQQAYKFMLNASAKRLASDFLNKSLPESAQDAVEAFLERYGMRGIGEIDIGRPRWREDPTPIMQVLLNYLHIEDESQAPDVVFQRGEGAAEAAIEHLEAAVRKTFGGRLKARVVRWAARRVRAFAGLRESPKFHIIQMMGIIRWALLDSGKALVGDGLLECADDLFYLYLDELEALSAGESRDWAAMIAERRRSYEREMLRLQVPRLLLSNGRAYYEGLDSSEREGVLVGSPVSPGVAEGAVRVVVDPRRASLSPGDILVCPATDPAWTPLFLSAGGLIMEVGGLMTHGSVVAREYGIPAVVGVHQATSRLKSGQCVRIDGSAGKIIILDAPDI